MKWRDSQDHNNGGTHDKPNTADFRELADFRRNSVCTNAGAAHFIHIFVFNAALKITERTSSIIDDSLVQHVRAPGKLVFLLIGISIAIP